MICPVCHKPMIVVEQEKIELDYCPKCSGVWFDAGELELLLDKLEVGSSGLDNVFTLPEAESAEHKHKCPLCQEKMRKASVGQDPRVIIDVCPRKEGLWFDGGEVGHVIKQCMDKACAPNSQGKVLAFLGETLKAGKVPESEGGAQ